MSSSLVFVHLPLWPHRLRSSSLGALDPRVQVAQPLQVCLQLGHRLEESAEGVSLRFLGLPAFEGFLQFRSLGLGDLGSGFKRLGDGVEVELRQLSGERDVGGDGAHGGGDHLLEDLLLLLELVEDELLELLEVPLELVQLGEEGGGFGGGEGLGGGRLEWGLVLDAGEVHFAVAEAGVLGQGGLPGEGVAPLALVLEEGLVEPAPAAVDHGGEQVRRVGGVAVREVLALAALPGLGSFTSVADQGSPRALPLHSEEL